MRDHWNYRDWGLDALKFLCACMVICIHCTFPGSEQLRPFMRPAVVVFFMITGYYYENTKRKGRRAAQIKKIVLLYLCIYPIYALWDFSVQAFPLIKSGISPLICFREWLIYCIFGQKEGWIQFFLFNYVSNDSHLWYLAALLYVLLFVSLWEHFFERKKLYPLIPILLCMNLLLGSYGSVILGKDFKIIYSRNFLFVGLPCFLLGDYLHRKKAGSVMNAKALWWMLLLATAGTALEVILLRWMGAKIAYDFYVSTGFAATALFLLAATPKKEPGPWLERASRIGRDDSQWIYYFHPLVMTLVGIMEGKLTDYAWVQTICDLFQPILVLGITWSGIQLFRRMTGRIKKSSRFVRKGETILRGTVYGRESE